MSSKNVWVLILAGALSLGMTAGCSKNPLASTRSDAEIAAEVQNKINADANIATKQITVNAANGTVTLNGLVASETERLAAANDAGQVEGVKTVVNNLQVGGTSTGSMTPMNEPVTTASNTQPRNPRPAQPRTAPRSSSSVPSNSTGLATAPATTTPVVAKVTIPEGTELSIRTIDEVSSEEAQVGDTFMSTLDSPVFVGDTIAIPARADVQGRVVEVKSAGKFAGRSELVLQLTRVSFNGRSYNIDTTNWSKTGASRGKNTAAKVGGGAALGAIIGGIAGGGKGAAIGAGVGAGAGTGVQAVTKGQQIVLRPETLLTFTLESPVTVTPSSTSNRSRSSMDNNE